MVVTWGPAEESLAAATVAAATVAQAAGAAVLAPPTDLVQLTAILRQARRLLTCDTGPMTLGVAVGPPTLGIFVATEPARYGYTQPPHAVVDARSRPVAAS